MKLVKLLLLLGLLTVTGCDTEENQNNINNNDTTTNTEVADREQENSNNEETTPDNSNNETTTPDNNNDNSSEEDTNNNEEDTNTENENTENNNTEENNENTNNSSEDNPVNTEEEVSYKINLYNPTCGTFSKEVLNDRLKEYINSEAKTDLVSSIKGSNCQLGANFPTKGNNVLIVGSSSTAGSLEFTFTKTVKKFSIKAQTYHKPYSQGGVDYPNVDPDSSLNIMTDGASPVFFMDLKPVEDSPVEKAMDIEINNTTLTLSSVTDSRGRVFIKEITFVL